MPGAVVLQGVVNVTPDSFSDGGQFMDPARAVEHGLRLLEEGADWLDVGGESTRPGAQPVDQDTELSRVIPVIQGVLARAPQAVISVDTTKAAVARASLDAGARVINDVSALADPEMAEVCARAGATVILMHMRGQPATMQRDTAYEDLVAEVIHYLNQRVQIATRAGIPADRIWVDAGLGFGKAPADNPRLVAATGQIGRATGCPVLVGASRKRFVGELSGVAHAADRVHGSIGAALAAVAAGASGLRVHDVAATRQALAVYNACSEGAR